MKTSLKSESSGRASEIVKLQAYFMFTWERKHTNYGGYSSQKLAGRNSNLGFSKFILCFVLAWNIQEKMKCEQLYFSARNRAQFASDYLHACLFTNEDEIYPHTGLYSSTKPANTS